MDRDGLVFLAKLDEQAERYDQMVERMTAVVETATTDLSVEERNLLSIAFKNVAGMRRASWRVVLAVQKQYAANRQDSPELSKALRTSIEDELSAIASRLITMVETKLLPLAETSEAKIFYHKMKGDYGRYMAEYAADPATRKCLAGDALRAYEEAQQLALAEMPPTHCIRLGLALNFSVFHYDILHDPAEACKMAKQAFDDAIAELDTLADDSYRDSTLVMQLLRDNITLWTSEDTGDDRDEPLA